MKRSHLVASIVGLVSLVGISGLGCAVAPQVTPGMDTRDESGDLGPDFDVDLGDPGVIDGKPHVPCATDPGVTDEGAMCGRATAVTLVAGQTIEAGRVKVENNGVDLCVSYETAPGWLLAETHVDVALEASEIAQTESGNPAPGAFAAVQVHDPEVQFYRTCLSLEELGFEAGMKVAVATHAALVRVEGGEVVQKETGWGDGAPFAGGSWAEYFEHTIQACTGGTPFEGGCAK